MVWPTMGGKSFEFLYGRSMLHRSQSLGVALHAVDSNEPNRLQVPARSENRKLARYPQKVSWTCPSSRAILFLGHTLICYKLRQPRLLQFCFHTQNSFNGS